MLERNLGAKQGLEEKKWVGKKEEGSEIKRCVTLGKTGYIGNKECLSFSTTHQRSPFQPFSQLQLPPLPAIKTNAARPINASLTRKRASQQTEMMSALTCRCASQRIRLVSKEPKWTGINQGKKPGKIWVLTQKKHKSARAKGLRRNRRWVWVPGTGVERAERAERGR